MVSLHSHNLLQEACIRRACWGLYIFFNDCDDFEERVKAVPFLKFLENLQVLLDGEGWLLFESREECDAAFWQCVGDDGPTQANPYTGPARAYALTCGPNGAFLNENT